jgi:hypothetical protein
MNVTMELKSVIRSQYRAALGMLRQTIERCPPELWLRAGDTNPTWRLAFHTLFYTHLYLSPTDGEFRAWAKHREYAEILGRFPWPPHNPAPQIPAYTQIEVLEYLDLILDQLDELLERNDLEAPSGFHWLDMNKTELLLYNLRHLQQHTGELAERLGSLGLEIDWVGMGSQD